MSKRGSRLLLGVLLAGCSLVAALVGGWVLDAAGVPVHMKVLAQTAFAVEGALVLASTTLLTKPPQ